MARPEVRTGSKLVVTTLARLCSWSCCFAFAALLSGCAPARKKPAFPWPTAMIARPIIPAPEISAADEPGVASEAPDLDSGISAILRSPARPHVAAPASSPEEPARPELPTIAPQLSPQESAAAQQDTNASLSAAEKNLERASGKGLNATQADMLSKIRGFMNDARQAAKTGDWTRARNLAQKAQVLSEELAKSL